MTQAIKGYLTLQYVRWTFKTFLSDWRKYGRDTALWNLYVNAMCAVDLAFRAEYEGTDADGDSTRYRWIGA